MSYQLIRIRQVGLTFKNRDLRKRRFKQTHGWPFSFLIHNGRGVVWKGEEEGRKIDEEKEEFDLISLMDSLQRKEGKETEIVELEDKRKLGIATLGSLKLHPRISKFRQFIEGWRLSYFTPDVVSSLPLAGPQKHLNIHGDNLSNVIHKGLGRMPENMRDTDDPAARILLDNLPKLLKGYGRTFAAYPPSFPAAVLIVCDLDKRCFHSFREQFIGILKACQPALDAYYCIAIEEGEAWFLGDLVAIRSAYPRAKQSVLDSYVKDSICGTWEKLADAIYPDGSEKLSAKSWIERGYKKAKWAEAITPYMDAENNDSQSFRYFRDKFRVVAGCE